MKTNIRQIPCLFLSVFTATALSCAAVAAVAAPCGGEAQGRKGWYVAELNGAPGLWHDGKPVPPILFWQWELQERDVKSMSDAGIDLFAMMGSFPHYEHPYWRDDGTFDTAYYDREFDALLGWNPSAQVLPRIFATAPDRWSEFYLPYREQEGKDDRNPCTQLYLEQMGEFYRAGAPFDWYLVEDIDAVLSRNYKTVVFLDCQYLTDEHYSKIMQLKGNGRSLVWFHAPGYASQTGLSASRMKALCGFDYGTTNIVARDFGNHYGVFSPGAGLSSSRLRDIYRRSGVHIYTDSDDSGWIVKLFQKVVVTSSPRREEV